MCMWPVANTHPGTANGLYWVVAMTDMECHATMHKTGRHALSVRRARCIMISRRLQRAALYDATECTGGREDVRRALQVGAHRQALDANVDACFSACKCKQSTKDTATGILQGRATCARQHEGRKDSEVQTKKTHKSRHFSSHRASSHPSCALSASERLY